MDEDRAEKLYLAVSAVLQEHSVMGLLGAAGDARARVPWQETAPKTRDLFRLLSVKLTELDGKTNLGT